MDSADPFFDAVTGRSRSLLNTAPFGLHGMPSLFRLPVPEEDSEQSHGPAGLKNTGPARDMIGRGYEWSH
jgi:hypothetical protein